MPLEVSEAVKKKRCDWPWNQVYFDETGTSQEYTLPQARAETKPGYLCTASALRALKLNPATPGLGPQDAADVRSYTFRKSRSADLMPIDAVSPCFVVHARVTVRSAHASAQSASPKVAAPCCPPQCCLPFSAGPGPPCMEVSCDCRAA